MLKSFPVDTPNAFWTTNIENPFSSSAERDSAIETYNLSDMVKFVEWHVREDARLSLLKIIEENIKRYDKPLPVLP